MKQYAYKEGESRKTGSKFMHKENRDVVFFVFLHIKRKEENKEKRITERGCDNRIQKAQSNFETIVKYRMTEN